MYAVLLTSNVLFLTSQRRILRVYEVVPHSTVVASGNTSGGPSSRANDDESPTTTRTTDEPTAQNKLPSATPTEASTRWPPLHELVDSSDDTVTGIKSDVSFLLDIAVLGHAKCATTYISKWLQQHPDVAMFHHEVCDLYDSKPALLVRRLYAELPPNNATHAYQRGFKCPGHFSRVTLRYLQTYFPHTKLIVGLRHPVQYFESYYNFRFRHPKIKLRNRTLPPAEALIGACTPASQGVCTDHAKFHHNLAKLGKTNWTSVDEQRLLHLTDDKHQGPMPRVGNPLFLYDVEQLHDPDASRTAQFRSELQRFLGLSAPPLTPLRPHPAVTARGGNKPKVLDICEPRYEALRRELLNIGKRASLWIRRYFVSVDSVTVSSPEHFAAILQTWKDDPCAARTNRTKVEQE